MSSKNNYRGVTALALDKKPLPWLNRGLAEASPADTLFNHVKSGALPITLATNESILEDEAQFFCFARLGPNEVYIRD